MPAEAGPRETAPSTDSARIPSGSVQLTFRRDDVLEYELTISNADHAAFGSGYVYRIAGPSGPRRVATLFTGASLSGPHVQLRGTGLVTSPMRPSDLLERIREAPESYSVLVVSVESRNQGLVGRLR